MRKLPERYVLFVSTLSIRKNHQLVTRVWRALIAKHGADKMPHLVFVGQIGWLVDELIAELRDSRYLDGKVMIFSDFSDDEVRQAYGGCLFTVYPSLAEGWGLPIAESLEHGKLCVASNATSMKEVGGDLVDYLDPEDFTGVVATIERIIFDAEYRQQRETEIAAKYSRRSWSETYDALIGSVEQLWHADPVKPERDRTPSSAITERTAAERNADPLNKQLNPSSSSARPVERNPQYEAARYAEEKRSLG